MSGAGPRLLYVAYFFPPAPAIGAVRAWNTAKHLTRLGWSVTVVTPRPALWLHPEEPERVEAEITSAGFTRVLTGHRWAMLSPELIRWLPGPLGWFFGAMARRLARLLGAEPTAGWARSAESACAGLKRGDFDLVLATSPRDSFRLAGRLARRIGCPFVLDYRDPWTGNPHAARDAARPDPEEAALLAECAAATVVSPSWADLIGGLFGVSGKMRVLSNGFDPRMFEDVRAHRFDHFAIVYAGTLYPPKRVLEPVLRALGAFTLRPDAVPAKLHYYGDHGRAVEEAAVRAGVSRHVVVHGAVSRRAALEAQKGAGLVVVVASADEDGSLADKGVVPGKVFDCMALGRPALVVAPRGSDLYAIAGAAGGMRCFTGGDIAGMAAFVAEVANGEPPPKLGREAYQWDVLAKELDAVLRGSLRVP